MAALTLTDAIFGPLTGTPQIEFAVLDTLEAWVPFMLKVLERRLGVQRDTLLAPPGRNSYKGGIDLDSWEGHCLPNIVAVVKPTGEADRNMSGYSQMFEVTVAPVVEAETEDEARILCGHIATAVMASLAQHGNLGGIASNTTLISAPVPEFPDPAQRTVVRAPMAFSVYVEGLVDPLAGTGTDLPPDSPQYPDDPDGPFEDWPEHLSTHVDVTGIDTPAVAPTGDRAGANVSVVFSEETASMGVSGAYRVRTDTLAIRFTLRCTGAPVGSPLTVEAILNGVAIGTLAVADGSTGPRVLALAVQVHVGDLLSVNATSVGATIAALGVTAQIDLGA